MKLLFSLFIALSLTTVGRAADPVTVTDVRIKEIQARQYLCAKKQLKLAELPDFATKTIADLYQKAAELKLGQAGPVVITYHDFRGDPEQTFTAELAVPIFVENVKDVNPFYVRKDAKVKCASVIYQGPLSGMGEAWQNFVSKAMAKGDATGDSREVFLYWEGHDSANNIIELQVELK